MHESELISPNLHVTLIHYPLAMLIVGTLIETFSFLWRQSSFRIAGRWMILIGALSMIPATCSGVFALHSVIGGSPDAAWVDRKAASVVLIDRPEVWIMLRRHMQYQSIATGVAAAVVLLWLGASDNLRKMLHVTLVIVLLATCAGMIFGAYFGGESIYRKGVGVASTQPNVNSDANGPAEKSVASIDQPTRAEILFPPLELHTVIAGVALALSVLSIGLSFRKMITAGALADDPIVTAGPITERKIPRTPPSSVEMVRTFNPDLEVELKTFIPAGRFWMLTCIIAFMTALGGLFVLARSADLVGSIRDTPKQAVPLLWHQIKPDPPQKINRLLAHTVAGGAIVVFPIILALLARFAPRQRFALLICTLLLSLAIAMQVWGGILLLLDSTTGPIYRYNSLSASTAAP